MPIYFKDLPLKKSDELAIAHPILDRSRSVVLMSGDEPKFPHPDYPSPSTDKLAEELKRHGVEFDVTRGKYEKPERSIIAYDMDRGLADQLARKYGQESYVHIEPNGMAKLHYVNGVYKTHDEDPGIPQDGKHRPESGSPQVVDTEPEDNYTYVPSINKFVTLGFDWSPQGLKSDGEKTMKNEYSVAEVKAEIAKVLKKYEEALAELRKGEELDKKSPPGHERQVEHIAESYEKKGKSPGQAKAIAAATAWKEHGEESKGHRHKKAETCAKCGKAECACKGEACKKCGEMSKAGEMCAKCGEMSAGGTKKNEAVSMMEKKGDKSAKGPQETPDKTKEAAEASGSGGDVAKGKLGKAEEDIAMLLELEDLFKAEGGRLASLRQKAKLAGITALATGAVLGNAAVPHLYGAIVGDKSAHLHPPAAVSAKAPVRKKEGEEESSEETSSPERSSHEETPSSEESKKTKKSVHNVKSEDMSKAEALAKSMFPLLYMARSHGIKFPSNVPGHPDYVADHKELSNQVEQARQKLSEMHGGDWLSGKCKMCAGENKYAPLAETKFTKE